MRKRQVCGDSGPDSVSEPTARCLGAQAATLANLGRDGEAREVYQRFVAAGGGQRPTTIAGLKRHFADAARVPVWGAYVERVFAVPGAKLGMAEQ